MAEAYNNYTYYLLANNADSLKFLSDNEFPKPAQSADGKYLLADKKDDSKLSVDAKCITTKPTFYKDALSHATHLTHEEARKMVKYTEWRTLKVW